VGAGVGIGAKTGVKEFKGLGVGELESKSGRGLSQSKTLARSLGTSEWRGASWGAPVLWRSGVVGSSVSGSAICRRDAGAPRWGSVCNDLSAARLAGMLAPPTVVSGFEF